MQIQSDTGTRSALLSRCKSRPGEPTTAQTYVSTCLCMQANRCKHVRTFLIGYRSGGTHCVFTSRGVCWNCGPLTREQCLPAPRRPPGSSCCLSLLAGGFRPTTHSGTPSGTLLGNNVHCNNDWSSRSRTCSQARHV